MWPPGGTQTPGKVLMWAALLVTRTSLSLLSRMTTTPTSTPRWEVSAGRRSRPPGLRQVMGQKGGWLSRLPGEEEREEVEVSLLNINLLSLVVKCHL